MKESFQYYILAFKNYLNFSGRSSRKEFWYFVLYNTIISIVLYYISRDLYNLYSLIVFLPSLAISVRRLHDIGKSGWWVLISLVPIIGAIWLIILFLQKGIDEEKAKEVEKGEEEEKEAREEDEEEANETEDMGDE